MTDRATTTPTARHSVGDVDEFCTPLIDGADLAIRFDDGRTQHHDLTTFMVKASLGSYDFESEQTSFTLTFVDKPTGGSAAQHIRGTQALNDSGYNDFYNPLRDVAGEFKESWRTRPVMLVRYVMLWVTLPFLVGGAVMLLFAGAALGIMMPAMFIAATLTDQPLPETLLGSGVVVVFVAVGVVGAPLARTAFPGMLGMLAQNYWATPPQQAAHIDATMGTSAGDPHRLRNLMFYNQPRWISVATPYVALVVGLAMLLKQHNNPDINVGNSAPVLATVILVAYVGVQFVFAIKMLIDSRTMQCDDAAWIEANVTAENSLMTRANLVPLLRHGVFAAFLLVGAAALFALA